jgi:hypothetical protein
VNKSKEVFAMFILTCIILLSGLFLAFDQMFHFIPRETKPKFRKLEIYEDYVIDPRNGEIVFKQPRIKMLN